MKTDAAFEQQFRVEYFEMGCTSPSSAAVRAYNARIAACLQATYGRVWWRVRPDKSPSRPFLPARL